MEQNSWSMFLNMKPSRHLDSTPLSMIRVWSYDAVSPWRVFASSWKDYVFFPEMYVHLADSTAEKYSGILSFSCNFHRWFLAASSRLERSACVVMLVILEINTSRSLRRTPMYSQVKLQTSLPHFFTDWKILCLASVGINLILNYWQKGSNLTNNHVVYKSGFLNIICVLRCDCTSLCQFLY